MLSANYSTDCCTFDPKGKILQVRNEKLKPVLTLLFADRLRKGSC